MFLSLSVMKYLPALLSIASWQFAALAVKPEVVRAAGDEPVRCCCCASAETCPCGCDRPKEPRPDQTVRFVVCPCGASPASIPNTARVVVESARSVVLTAVPAVLVQPPAYSPISFDGKRVHDPPPDLPYIRTVIMLD